MGRWGVAVSGGADSVATLVRLRRLARRSADFSLAVIHLDHQLRGEESTADARLVADLARQFGLPLFLRKRTDIEGGTDWPANASARYRRMRLACYRAACNELRLDGVALGHHADDVAETTMLRLLRGSPRSGTMGLAGLRPMQVVAGVTLWRPMLGVRRDRLRTLLRRAKVPWREDASNATDATLRNRVRRLLAGRPDVTAALLALASSAARAEDWTAAKLENVGPDPADWAGLAEPPRRRAARRWLVSNGVPEDAATPATVDRLLAVLDPAGPRAADLPGRLRVRRSRTQIFTDSED